MNDLISMIDVENDISNFRRNNLIVFTNSEVSKNVSISNDDANQEGEIEQEMKNIRKRTDGRWEARIQVEGKRISLFADTQDGCAKKLTALKRKIKHNGMKQSPYPKKFQDFCWYWFERYKESNIGKSSKAIYSNYIRNEFSKIKCNVEDLTVDMLQSFINSYPPTRNREYIFVILRQILKKIYELDLSRKNLGDFLVKGRIRKGKISWFNLDEQKIILANLGDDYFSLSVYTLLLTGCRPNELATIKKENIKSGMILIEGTKTKNAKRWIKISPFLENKLKEQEGSEVFKNISLDVLRRKFKKFLNDIGVNGTLYKLRHTFATNLFYLGVPDKKRQSYMGHASSVLTNDIYTDFDPTIKPDDILNLYINLYPQF